VAGRRAALAAVFASALLLSLATRILSDALHVPGFYDTTGVYMACLALPAPLALIESLVTPLLLTLYYKAYLVAIWVYPLTAAVFLAARRAWSRLPVLTVLAPAFTYATSWFIVYVSFGHLWSYLPLLLHSRGYITLFMDALASMAIGYTWSRLLGGRSTRTLAAACIAFAAVAAASYAAVAANGWASASWFPSFRGYLEFHHKMDFVWLPLGAKGINNYYYPVTRFQRGAPGYQVWIGMYWVQGRYDPADVGVVSAFAVWDQNFWLGTHGCPNPYTYVDLVRNVTVIDFHGHRAYLMYGGMVSRSDVKPYEEVRLRGFFITYYDASRDRTAIIYACATQENIGRMMQTLWRIVKAWRIPG